MRKKSLFVALCWAMIMVGCSQLEYEETSEYPVAKEADSVRSMSADTEKNGWQVYSLYFLDWGTRKVRAKFRKELNGPRWYFYELDSVNEYKVLSDVAHSFLMLKTYESDVPAVTFTYYGDTIRLNHCGDYPKESPIYSLIVVTKKDGPNQMMKD